MFKFTIKCESKCIRHTKSGTLASEDRWPSRQHARDCGNASSIGGCGRRRRFHRLPDGCRNKKGVSCCNRRPRWTNDHRLSVLELHRTQRGSYLQKTQYFGNTETNACGICYPRYPCSTRLHPRPIPNGSNLEFDPIHRWSPDLDSSCQPKETLGRDHHQKSWVGSPQHQVLPCVEEVARRCGSLALWRGWNTTRRNNHSRPMLVLTQSSKCFDKNEIWIRLR